jgi:hypothetical protein
MNGPIDCASVSGSAAGRIVVVDDRNGSARFGLGWTARYPRARERRAPKCL